MIRAAIPLIAAGTIAWPGGALATQSASRAAAHVHNAQGRAVGEAVALRQGDIVRVRVIVHGFVTGTHGVHLHQTGRCDAPDFASAGPHWNPAGRQHGRLNPQGPHLGDLPNLQVAPDGSGRLEFTIALPAGTPAHANPLLDADGTAIVIHAAVDDDRTDPAGNSGSRIACGAFAPVR